MNMVPVGFMAGHWEWLIVILVLVLLFGAKKLPELARSLGKSLSAFKKGQTEGSGEEQQTDEAESDKDGEPPAS